MHASPRPRMRIASPLLRAGGELHVVGSDDVVTLADPDGAMHRLVELADGSRSTDELLCTLGAEYPALRPDDVAETLARLEAAGLFEDYAPRRRVLGGQVAAVF